MALARTGRQPVDESAAADCTAGQPVDAPAADAGSAPAWRRVGPRPGSRTRPKLSHPPEMMEPMATQLNLLRQEDDWRLDECTREAGRRGVAEARRILDETMKRSAAA